MDYLHVQADKKNRITVTYPLKLCIMSTADPLYNGRLCRFISLSTNFSQIMVITRPYSAIGSESDCRYKVMSLVPTWTHTFVEIDHIIISGVFLLLLLIEDFFCQLPVKYMNEVLVNCLIKHAKEKSVVR